MIARVPTWELGSASLAEIRAFLDAAYDGDFADEDWEHALGGVHVLRTEDGKLVGHASVVQRRPTHGGLGIRAGWRPSDVW